MGYTSRYLDSEVKIPPGGKEPRQDRKEMTCLYSLHFGTACTITFSLPCGHGYVSIH